MLDWRGASWLGMLIAGIAVSTAFAAHDERPRALKRSDVVFMYDDPDMYETYGCTVMGWAGSQNRARIELAHGRGVRLFAISVGFLTEFRRVIDYSDEFLDAAARNYAGEPFVVPWLWDHKYKEQPAWWWCTNSPLYQAYLTDCLTKRMPLGPDGLHIDDYRGSSGAVTWRSACFCRHCMAQFRDYLREHVEMKELQELGIDDLAEFDYRKYLVNHGVTVDSYQNKRSSLPLADAFYDFHVRTNTAFVGRYREAAEEIRGRPLTLCVNSGLSNPQALAIAPQLSYFCCEVRHGAASLAPATHPIYVYKLGDGLNRPIASTASGQDWAYVYEHGKTCLVRSWAALSYAFGHTLMAPHRQWCYSTEKGTHWYTGPAEKYAYLYRFVRDHARLLDDYEAVAPVAVVYDNAANRRNRGKLEPICVELAKRNVPFTVVIAGDNWLDYSLESKKLQRFEAVIVADDGKHLDERQRDILAETKDEGRLIKWPDDTRLDHLVSARIEVEGSDQVMVVPRSKPHVPEAPVVVHLLNRDYDGETDTLRAQENLKIRLTGIFSETRRFTAATLHAPGNKPVPIRVTHESADLVVEIPRLDLWGILELRGPVPE